MDCILGTSTEAVAVAAILQFTAGVHETKNAVKFSSSNQEVRHALPVEHVTGPSLERFFHARNSVPRSKVDECQVASWWQHKS